MADTYDARDVSITVDDETVAYLDSFGYDQSMANELQRCMDGESVWVKGTGEFTGTVVMAAVSDSRVNAEELFHNQETFDLVIKYAEGEPRESSLFEDCMLQDFGPSDYELDGQPTYEGSWEADTVEHFS